jgi:quercetin dioxygenase-like cupin family protein
MQMKNTMQKTRRSVTHVPPDEGKSVWMVGTDLITFKAASEDTDGAFALFDTVILPQGGPPLHIHHREDESFYVLRGQIEVFDDERTIRATTGSFVHIPKGTVHGFKNVGKEPARMLVLVTPAGLDKFFEEMGETGTDVSSPPPPPDQEYFKRFGVTAQKYGIEVVT